VLSLEIREKLPLLVMRRTGQATGVSLLRIGRSEKDYQEKKDVRKKNRGHFRKDGNGL
jgi:hypothetical protein